MKKVSNKQRQKNVILAKIKAELPKVCEICGESGNDLAHLLPKSIYPQYYLEPRNLVILCRDCHKQYDDSLAFRQDQGDLICRTEEFAESLEVWRYFKML